ncbi:MAG TPA: hypothetical protein VFW12_09400 [Candidatus Limnocylindria bacterium]|nr:hypothetical protein [Candidatus Limnocylindria bacterium]
MKRLSVSALLLALALSAFSPATAAAAQPSETGTSLAQTACEAGNARGGAAALAALVAAAVDVGGVNVCDVDVLNDSLNNLLQNADIHVLENILNNSPILNDLNISDITVDVDVLTGTTTISVLGAPVLVIQ